MTSFYHVHNPTKLDVLHIVLPDIKGEVCLISSQSRNEGL